MGRLRLLFPLLLLHCFSLRYSSTRLVSWVETVVLDVDAIGRSIKTKDAGIQAILVKLMYKFAVYGKTLQGCLAAFLFWELFEKSFYSENIQFSDDCLLFPSIFSKALSLLQEAIESDAWKLFAVSSNA